MPFNEATVKAYQGAKYATFMSHEANRSLAELKASRMWRSCRAHSIEALFRSIFHLRYLNSAPSIGSALTWQHNAYLQRQKRAGVPFALPANGMTVRFCLAARIC